MEITRAEAIAKMFFHLKEADRAADPVVKQNAILTALVWATVAGCCG